jgi:hypothetical protein
MINLRSPQGTVGVLTLDLKVERWTVTPLELKTDVFDIFHNERGRWEWEVTLRGCKVLLVLMEWFKKTSGHLQDRIPFSCSTITEGTKIYAVTYEVTAIPNNLKGPTELTVNFELPPKMTSLRTLLWILYLPETDTNQLPYWVRDALNEEGLCDSEEERTKLKAALRLKIRNILNDCGWCHAKKHKAALAREKVARKEVLAREELNSNTQEFKQWNLFDIV